MLKDLSIEDSKALQQELLRWDFPEGTIDGHMEEDDFDNIYCFRHDDSLQMIISKEHFGIILKLARKNYK